MSPVTFKTRSLRTLTSSYHPNANLGFPLLVSLQDKTGKSKAQATQDTIKEFLNNSQEIVDDWNEGREQSAKRCD